MIYDTAIIGGGAAGMMAAAQLADSGQKVCIIEKNKDLGRKLKITGKGRCNVTNNCQRDTFFNNIISGSKFLMSSYSAFSSADTMEFFENLGVPLKTERGGRVFPVSDNAADICEALIKKLKSGKTDIIHDRAAGVITENGRALGVCGERNIYRADNVIIASGGLSYPKTGSTGDGYEFARSLGHTVTELKPCLVPLIVVQSELCRSLMGLSLKNVELSLYKGEKCIYSEIGEMLFAHFGLTGPLVLKASAYIKDTADKSYRIEINCKPGLDREKLDARILRDFAISPNRIISNVLHSLLPSKMIEPILKLSDIKPDAKINSITKKQRTKLEKNIRQLRLDVKGFRPVSEAIITAGGVELKEIDPKTMESRLVPGVYFIGECIDAHGFTGGYNLQIAFSTACAAAKNIRKK